MSPRRVAYVVSEELTKISSQLPSNKNRSLLVHSLVSKLGLLSIAAVGDRSIHAIRPRMATERELCLYHDEDYIAFVLDPSNSRTDAVDHPDSAYSRFGIEDDCPPFPVMYKYVPIVAGATLTAAEQLVKGDADVAICWDGGRHHGHKSHAAGFCYVADCILAIMSLKRSPVLPLSQNIQRPRVMYLDLDLHFSDAVSQAFYAPGSSTTPQVLTLSIHHAAPGFYPATPLSRLPDVTSSDFDPLTLSIPLQQGAARATFTRTWWIVEAVKEEFRPHFVVVQCGLDGLSGDPCGIWNLSIGLEEGEMGWCVSRIIHEWNCKTLLLGGGGYNSPNAARAWAFLTSVAKGTPLLMERPIPDHFAFPLYAPSFAIGHQAGNMQDKNDDAYLRTVEQIFIEVIKRLKEKISGAIF